MRKVMFVLVLMFVPVLLLSQELLPPRALTATTSHLDRIELSWLPPLAPPPPGDTVELYNDDGVVDTTEEGYSYLGYGSPGGGMAVGFTPPVDGCYFIAAEYYMANNGVSFEAHVWGDDGGVPGEDIAVPMEVTTEGLDSTGSWFIVDFPSVELSGDPFYVGWIEIPPDDPFPAVGMDIQEEPSGLSFIYLPDYSMWANLNTDLTGFEDVNLMMRALVVEPSGRLARLYPDGRFEELHTSSGITFSPRRITSFVSGPAQTKPIRRVFSVSDYSSPKAAMAPEALGGYNVYRSMTPFEDVSDAELIAFVSDPSVTHYTDDDADLIPGLDYYYRVTAVYDGGESEPSNQATGRVFAASADAQILIYDYDDGDLLADGGDMAEDEFLYNLMLGELGIPMDSVIVSEQNELLDHFNLSNFDLVIIISGSYPQSVLSDDECQMIIDYLDGGGQVYWEGVDVGYNYGDEESSSETKLELYSHFRINWEHDGVFADTGNVRYLTANPSFFGCEFAIDYDFQSLADNYVDEISSNGAVIIMNSQEADPAPQVSTGRMSYYHSATVGYTTVFSGVYIGGMIDDLYPSTRARVLGSILEHFGISNTGVSEEAALPKDVVLSQNYPNPFNPATSISFAIPRDGEVELAVYNLLGECVETLVSGSMSAGWHSVVWDATDASSGVYFYNLRFENRSITSKMLLVK